jgi:hypothetical protein
MAAMIGRPLRMLLAATLLVFVSAHGVDARPGFSQTTYRASAFSTQATEYYCTSAVVQHIRNLATQVSLKSRTEQAQLYAYGRANNRYAYRSRGVDPQGVEAMLERSVPGTNWVQVRKHSLVKVLRTAARRMRATGLPAVLFVAGGKHVWTMNGYTATRDPASGSRFHVTHVQFSGPYFPRQKARYGWFDLAPNTRTSVERLAHAYFPYSERLAFGDHKNTPWNGYYVAIVPWLVDDDPDPSPTPTPVPTPGSTAEPTIEPTAEPEATPDSTSDSAPAPDPTAAPTIQATAEPPDPTEEPTAQPATLPPEPTALGPPT